MNEIITVANNTFLAEANAIIHTTTSKELFSDPTETIKVDKYEIVPWGENNDYPQQIMNKAGNAESVSANLLFNITCGYGQGIKPMLRVVENGQTVLHECEDREVLDFFEDNDVDGYFLEQLSDMHAFFNVFPEIIVSNDKKKIVCLRSKEACFSRWAVMDKKLGRITQHYYSAKWEDTPSKEDIESTPVLDRFNSLLSLEEELTTGKNFRFIVPINFPTPGRTYYQRAYWHTIFNSGWYDFLTMIPSLKKALLKNSMAIKYIIYIHERYFDGIFKAENIDPTDIEKVKARKSQEYQNIQDFLSGEKNAGKALISFKSYKAVASGVVEEKWIEVVPLKTQVEGGEYIQDSEEANNVVSYAMGVHSTLIGSTPGKNKGSQSGTDKRELYMIKQSMMKPFIHRLLKPLTLIKRFNKWPENLVFVVPETVFTTLDKNKSGKETKTEE